MLLLSEIAKLSLVVSDIRRELRELQRKKEASCQFDGHERAKYFLSPSPLLTRYTNVWKTLESMNYKYKKAFQVSISYLIININ